MTTPEFSRTERIDTIGAGARDVTISATEVERVALAKRIDLVAIERLEASFSIRREAAGIVAQGKVRAAVVQACAVTDDPIAVSVDESVALRFVASADLGEEELELEADALDTIPYDGAAIDLGEAAAETMALALDPFPRGPGAAAALKAAGVLSEEEAKPAGALAGLKAVLDKH